MVFSSVIRCKVISMMLRGLNSWYPSLNVQCFKGTFQLNSLVMQWWWVCLCLLIVNVTLGALVPCAKCMVKDTPENHSAHSSFKGQPWSCFRYKEALKKHLRCRGLYSYFLNDILHLYIYNIKCMWKETEIHPEVTIVKSKKT